MCLAQNWQSAHPPIYCMSKNSMSICVLYIQMLWCVFFFLPTSANKLFPFLGVMLSSLRIHALKQLLFCMFAFFFFLRERKCLAYPLTFVLPTNVHIFWHRNPVTACWLHEQPECLQMRKQGLRYKLFPWVTQP